MSSIDSVEAATGLNKTTITKINRLILETGAKDAYNKKGMATTFSGGFIWKDPNGKYWFSGINIGDSRIYIRTAKGDLIKLSEDDKGFNVQYQMPYLTAVLGDKSIELKDHQIINRQLKDGDIVVLMSDGIYTGFRARTMEEIVKAHSTPEALVNALRTALMSKVYIKKYGVLDDASILAFMAPFSREPGRLTSNRAVSKENEGGTGQEVLPEGLTQKLFIRQHIKMSTSL